MEFGECTFVVEKLLNQINMSH